MAKRLVFMPDYTADPLWDDETGAMVSLDRLPVGRALRERVRSWARQWDELADKSMLDAEEEEAWAPLREEQLALWRALQDELRGRYEVGLEVPPPGQIKRAHVVWAPGGTPELAGWFRGCDPSSLMDDD